MNTQQALKLASARLTTNNISNPLLEAELLLSHILKKPREFILAHPEKNLSKGQIMKFQAMVSRRLKGEPIAYLLKQKEFYGLNFYVDRRVLIPRPETELMIDEALRLAAHSSQSITLVDVGTGSGCIIITLAKKLSLGYPRLNFSKAPQLPISSFQYLATDISKSALKVARKNARLHKIDKLIKFLPGNLLAPILTSKFAIPSEHSGSQFVILANLPYLTPRRIKNSSSIQKEPKLALAAGKDGLKYYKKLFQQIKKLRAMSYELRDITVLCEIDPGQTKTIKQLIRQELPQAKLQIIKDWRGHNRLITVRV